MNEFHKISSVDVLIYLGVFVSLGVEDGAAAGEIDVRFIVASLVAVLIESQVAGIFFGASSLINIAIYFRNVVVIWAVVREALRQSVDLAKELAIPRFEGRSGLVDDSILVRIFGVGNGLAV